MAAIKTEYANTDVDLRSPDAFDTLNSELSCGACVLHYTQGDDGLWYASYEADRLNDDPNNDIRAILYVIASLSDAAKDQFRQCTVRDFNVGFHCGDTWAYNCSLARELLSAIAKSGCSVSITLYPMREPGGTPKVDQEGV